MPFAQTIQSQMHLFRLRLFALDHLAVDFMEVDFAYFLDNVFRLKRHKAETYKCLAVRGNRHLLRSAKSVVIMRRVLCTLTSVSLCGLVEHEHGVLNLQ